MYVIVMTAVIYIDPVHVYCVSVHVNEQTGKTNLCVSVGETRWLNEVIGAVYVKTRLWLALDQHGKKYV